MTSGAAAPGAVVAIVLVFVLVLVLGLGLGVGARVARPDLSGEEERWVRDLVAALGGNSPRVRKGAEMALLQVGAEAIPVVVEVYPTLKSEAAKKGVLRALEAMGRDEVVRVLGRMKEGRSKSESRKIDELLQALGGAAGPAAAASIPFEPARLESPDLAPLGARSAVRDAISLPGLATRHRAEVRGETLALDADGDGSLETVVARASPQVVSVGPAERKVPVLLFFERTWTACPAALGRARKDALAVEVLDADLDGVLGSTGDHLRVGEGAFGPVARMRRIPFGEGTATVGVRSQAGGHLLELAEDPRIPGLDANQEAGFRALNRARAALGRGAVLPDVDRCAGCRKHAQYLSLNANDPEHQGLGVHHETKGKPGYTEQGAVAAAATIVSSTSDAARAVSTFLATMLHRVPLLGDGASGFGIGSSGGGRGSFTVVWGEEPSVGEDTAPLVVPAPGQRQVPLRGSAEEPAPEDPPDWYDRPRGFPVSVHLGGMDLAEVEIALFLVGSATPVPGRLWTPASPVHGSFGGRTAFLMPAAPLERGPSYRVELRASRSGAPVAWTWTFRTD